MQYNQHADVPIPAKKMHYIKDSQYGSPEQERLVIDYNPNVYSTKEQAAKAFYEALRKVSAGLGQDQDAEVLLISPEESEANGFGRNWRVIWESGPYEWGIVASMEFLHNHKAGWFTEPYYGFDVCFTE